MCRSAEHAFSKPCRAEIELVAGHGVVGDAHYGKTVQHRSRVSADPSQPNLRQVHLLHDELFTELLRQGHALRPGDIGENITTRCVDLLSLPQGTRLLFSRGAEVELTGLRNPCRQLDGFAQGLMSALRVRGEGGEIERKAGVMAVVTKSGRVCPGDSFEIELPALPHQPLERV